MYTTYTWTDKKELKTRSAPVSVYTFKDNKVILVDRNEEVYYWYISLTAFYDQSISKVLNKFWYYEYYKKSLKIPRG